MLHAASSLLLLASCFVAIASADSLPPSLVWTADPIAYALDTGTGALAEATDTGMTVDGGCVAFGPSCGADFIWYRTFTVTSPGTFVLSASASDELGAFNCWAGGGCASSATVSASFTVSDLLTFSTILSGSGSATNPATCPPIGCQVSLDLTDSETSLITLGVGNYELFETYNGYADASGNLTIDFQGQFSLVPTPEPKADIAVIGLAFAIMLLLKRTRIRMLTHGG